MVGACSKARSQKPDRAVRWVVRCRCWDWEGRSLGPPACTNNRKEVFFKFYPALRAGAQVANLKLAAEWRESQGQDGGEEVVKSLK